MSSYKKPSAPTKRITVAKAAWDFWWEAVRQMNHEVAMFGYVEQRNEDEVHVSELFLVPQEVTGSEVDFMTDGLPFAIEKAVAEGKLDQLRFCVHSHVNMGVFWSQTDENMIHSTRRFSPNLPYFISAVCNKKGETKGRWDMWGTTELGVEYHMELDATFEPDIPVDTELSDTVAQQLNALVTVSRPAPKPKSKQKPKSTPTKGKSSGKGGVAGDQLVLESSGDTPDGWPSHWPDPDTVLDESTAAVLLSDLDPEMDDDFWESVDAGEIVLVDSEEEMEYLVDRQL